MNAPALWEQAVAFYQAGNFAEAERVCLILLAAAADAPACHLLGLVRFQQGRLGEALVDFDAALALRPDYAEALNNRGAVLQDLQRFDEALASYDRVLAIRPGDIRALNNRGNVLRALKRHDAALAQFGQVLALRPDYAGAWNNRGNTLQEIKRFEEALADFNRALALEPGNAATLYNRGLALSALNRWAEALEAFERLTALQPNDAMALYHCGAVLHQLGRFGDALDRFDKALAADAALAAAWNDRGNALWRLGRPQDALASYERALDLQADFAETLTNCAAVLNSLGRHAEALADCDRALAVAPDMAAALRNRGNALLALKRPGDALADFERALARAPADEEAWNNRAGALRSLERLQEALASCDTALRVRPGYADAHYNRGALLQQLNRPAEALESYDRALAIDPDFVAALASRAGLQWLAFRRHAAALADLERVVALDGDYPYARGDLLHLRMYGADWRSFAGDIEFLDAGVRAGRKVATPFVYQAISDSPADLQACAAIYTSDRYPGVAAPAHKRQKRDKIRLGYVSGEFRSQATAFLAAGLYECHDKDRFELVAFDNGRADDSAVRKRLEGSFDKFVAISHLPDGAAAAEIRAQEIDILINLNGYFGAARMGIFAHRPAPLQVSYLGFPGTLGADYIDYILADRVVIPPDEQRFYTEKVVYLPDCYQVNDARRAIPQGGPTRAGHGLPDDATVFCNFNQGYKLTPAVFAAWMRILKRTDRAVLWLLESGDSFASNLRREAVAQGVAAERLIFAPLVASDEHLARLALADLFIDSVPCNAHTTASDALWAGLPLLTCRGNGFAGRVAASLLDAIGLPELVAASLEDYEALAVRLGADSALLRSLRQRLAVNRPHTPLFDTDSSRRHIEAAYTTMWQMHVRGESPCGFAIARAI